MGLDITQYLLIGIKLDYKKYSEIFYNLYDTNEGHLTDFLRIIIDGMGGNYVYVGHVIEETEDDWDNFEILYDGFNVMKNKYSEIYVKVDEEIQKELINHIDEKDLPAVDIFYIKHYS